MIQGHAGLPLDGLLNQLRSLSILAALISDYPEQLQGIGMAGINLEYYFCRVDPSGWGCGTKLPHNITALLGVMDGAASDLRTGLPWQMVEIHEPVRLLIVCETTPEVMQKVLDGNPMGRGMTENGWVQLAVQLPDTNEILLYRDGAFRPYHPQATQLPSAASSADWYRGCRDHLEFAEIGAA